jgi:glycosyltransferase involved in cell wall biosynthesis
MQRPMRLAVVRDFRAENWPSMNCCADQLLSYISEETPGLDAVDFDPPFRRRFQRLPILGRLNTAFNADRLLNRHLFLSQAAREAAPDYDLFHVADHTYAHIVHSLPNRKVGVYCHDLDAFRCILDSAAEPRPWWFRKLAQRTLDGVRKAAVVFHNSQIVGRQLLEAGLVSSDRLVHAPPGVALEFTAIARNQIRLPANVDVSVPYLLHVGSNIARKRIDILLDVFAATRRILPWLRLIQVGGPWPATNLAQIERLGLGAAITQVRNLNREQLATLYRQATAVLVTSDAEGFGLPVIEALACGSTVVASDLPVFREIGGDACLFCPVGDVSFWCRTVLCAVCDSDFSPPVDRRLAVARQYSWRTHAHAIGSAYAQLLNRKECTGYACVS